MKNFINSNYTNYTQKIANWNNSNFWSTNQYSQSTPYRGVHPKTLVRYGLLA